MADEVLISVIVPIYNVAPYLDRCVDSLVKQTYRNLEIILVDDGSTDDSGALADRWGARDRRITVYHKENGGLSDARNYGIDRAQGEYLSFVDSDDFVDEAFIQVLYDTLVSAGTRMSAVGYRRFTDSIEMEKAQNRDVQLLTQQEALKSLCCVEFGDYAWNKLYEKSLFSDVRYPFGKIMEDIGTTFRLVGQCDGVAFCAAPLYFYRQREDSISHGDVKRRALNRYEMETLRYQYLTTRLPEFRALDMKYFRQIFEWFPFVGTQMRRQIVADAAAILKRIGPEATLKMRLKCLAIRWVPGLYAWNKKRSMARYEKRAGGPRNGRP